jgi:hypothetical protein
VCETNAREAGGETRGGGAVGKRDHKHTKGLSAHGAGKELGKVKVDGKPYGVRTWQAIYTGVKRTTIRMGMKRVGRVTEANATFPLYPATTLNRI